MHKLTLWTSRAIVPDYHVQVVFDSSPVPSILVPSPAPLPRRSPLAVPIYMSTKADRTGHARTHPIKRMIRIYKWLSVLLARASDSSGRPHPTRTSPLPPTKVFVPVRTTSSTPARPVPGDYLATKKFDFDVVALWNACKLLIGWALMTFLIATMVFVRFLAGDCAKSNGSADPNHHSESTTDLDFLLDLYYSLEHPIATDEGVSRDSDLTIADNLAPEDMPLPTATANGLIETSVPGSAPADDFSALLAWIDTKTGVQGSTSMNGTSVGGKTLEPAVSINSIGCWRGWATGRKVWFQHLRARVAGRHPAGNLYQPTPVLGLRPARVPKRLVGSGSQHVALPRPRSREAIQARVGSDILDVSPYGLSALVRELELEVMNNRSVDYLDRFRNPLSTRYVSGRYSSRPVPVVHTDPFEQMEPDEEGAELGKEARVWKVYVKETDQWDAELVDGWNKSLDVLLVFVSAFSWTLLFLGSYAQTALFSAISTAFLIESSSALRQDPNDVSAAALISISATLRAMANNSSMDFSPSESDFVPSRHAVIINTLWYLSLGISLATSLLAMLAKDWCHSFSANRVGHPWDQALRRQRKWVMIEKWKMQELIVMLPSLIHLSLMIFAVGLCMYVWDMNHAVAIPVICVTGVAFGFYVCSSLMASVMRLFPYTTIISRALQSELACKWLIPRGRKLAARIAFSVCAFFILCWGFVHIATIIIGLMVIVLLLILKIALDFLHSLFPRNISEGNSLFQTGLHVFVSARSGSARYLSNASILLLRAMELELELEYSEPAPASPDWHKKDQGHMTSLALKWLIQNCETPTSVDITLQAIAGASSKISRDPLTSSQAALHIFRRLMSSSSSGSELDTKLYTRALTFLGSQSQPTQNVQGSMSTEDIDVLIWELKSEHERQVVNLINNNSFSPTPENLQTLIIGNTAILVSVRQIKGSNHDKSGTFNSVISLLLDHIESRGKFDAAALHSLGYAAILLTSCSPATLMSSTVIQKCIRLCIQRSLSKSVCQSEGFIDPCTAILICILLRAQYTLAQDTQINTTLPLAANLLMNERLWSSSSQSAFYRVALYEIVFNPERYGTNVEFLGMSLGLLLEHPHLEGRHIEPRSNTTVTYNFLAAINQVYDLVLPSSLQEAVAEALPAPVYYSLVKAACGARTHAEQTTSQRLLSRFAFLGMHPTLISSVDDILVELWETYYNTAPPAGALKQAWDLFDLKRTPVHDKRVARSRHLAASQLWLLLYLVGDALTPQQQELSNKLKMRTGLKIQVEHMDRAKFELEEHIIMSYIRGEHFGVYSARVIECILQDRGSQGHEELLTRVKSELQRVSKMLRGLSSFSHPDTIIQANCQSTSADRGRSPSPSSERTLATELPPFKKGAGFLTEAQAETPPSRTLDKSNNTNHVMIPVIPGTSEDT